MIFEQVTGTSSFQASIGGIFVGPKKLGYTNPYEFLKILVKSS
jgi:hypothetical protein